MTRTSWDDYRIAYQVARSGSLNKAGNVLHMNHATVLRHVNQLETALGIKLFIRHQRGYQLTEAGELMMANFPSLVQQFERFEDALVGVEKSISGRLRITTVPDYVAMLNAPLKLFRDAYPKLRIEIIASDEILSLAKGEAHVALRAGTMPKEADLVAKKVSDEEIHYYAAQSYIDRYGFPETKEAYRQHFWALPSAEKRRIPWVKELLQYIDEDQVVYQSNNFADITDAVIEGLAIGPVGKHRASRANDLRRVDFPTYDSSAGLWFVYHKDLKNSARIQTLYQFLIRSLNY